MGLLWFLAHSMLYLLLICSLFTFTVTNGFPSVQCHEDESSALLQFKQSFVISKFASDDSISYPKTESWKQNTDCCSWDGVECDEQTGHVIGLHLNSSQLYGSIGSNSTLFHILQLQRLNLSDNHFNYSQIPSRLGHLSSLTHLDLSWSKLSGEIPHEISHLSNLLDLRLCGYYDPSSSVSSQINLLQLKSQFFESMIENLTNLEVLSLSFVNISSPIPYTLTNLSSLQHLDLYNSLLSGEFPVRIFHLPKLKSLDVGLNEDFNGYLPASIGNHKALQVLDITLCNFSGSIPSSLSNLTQLISLDISYNHFKGNLTSSLSNLTQLDSLRIGGNDIACDDISWIGKLNRLHYLDLSTTDIGNKIPNSFANLTQLSCLKMRNANLVGKIPPWIMNFTNLSYLDLTGNNLHGEIPRSIFSLENLKLLYLEKNLLVDQLELSMFLSLKSLAYLSLGYNNLSLLTKTSSLNESLPRNFVVLQLTFCNINEFPKLLKDQDQLEYLDLSDNRIHDTIPNWIWRNENILVLAISNNLLIGEISPLICNLKSLMFLDLSFNKLSGIIPPCLGNQLFDFIPQAFLKPKALKMIDFSQNNLHGQLPKTLANCRMLKYLDVNNNQINGSFPFWLGTLPELRVLVLRSNKFSGVISSPSTSMFPKLHVIDLSQNDFSGNFPSELIKNWDSMKASNVNNELKYEGWRHFRRGRGMIPYTNVHYPYSLKIFNKGNLMVFERLQEFYFFKAIDLSNNKIGGEIPDAIGDLNGLVLLNLSNNLFTGGIPSSLGKLSQLEALDLSHNSLSGKIPQELTQLNFLEVFNVSYNCLSGRIPQNTQFDTFGNCSFEGNQGLCGKPLLNSCEDQEVFPPATDEDEDSWSLFEFDWKIVAIGYVGGLVFGLAMGSTLSLEKHALRWLKLVGIEVQRR